MRGLLKRTAFMLLTAVAVAAGGQEPAQDALTLDDAVRLALERNRGLAVAALGVERAGRKVDAARTKRLPSLQVEGLAGTTLNTIEVSFPTGAFGDYPGTGPIPAEDTIVKAPRTLTGTVTATVAQPISQLHKIGLNTKLSELSRDVERQKLREERAAVAADVRRAYYALLQLTSARAARREQAETCRELERVVGEQVRREVALVGDGLDVKAELAEAEYELARVEGDLATARERLNELMGRDLDAPLSVVGTPGPSLEEVDLTAAQRSAAERRPDLAQARLGIEQADTDRRLKKAESIPDVSLALSYYSFFNVDLLPRTIAQAGLQVKWEPFDWGRRGKERAEKELQLEQAKATERRARDLARIDVGQRFRDLHEARLLVSAEELSRDAAREKLRVVRERHEREAALFKDLLSAQAQASVAQAEYDQALMTYWTAKADFQKAIGEEQ